MPHTDGFIPIDAPDVLYLLEQVPAVQFWRLADWPTLFHRCHCCAAQKVGAYQMISAEQARRWAKDRLDV